MAVPAQPNRLELPPGRLARRFRIEPVAQAYHSRPTDRLFQRYPTWEAPALISNKDKTVERYSQDKDKTPRIMDPPAAPALRLMHESRSSYQIVNGRPFDDLTFVRR
jgi:hypothetical protein